MLSLLSEGVSPKEVGRKSNAFGAPRGHSHPALITRLWEGLEGAPREAAPGTSVASPQLRGAPPRTRLLKLGTPAPASSPVPLLPSLHPDIPTRRAWQHASSCQYALADPSKTCHTPLSWPRQDKGSPGRTEAPRHGIPGRSESGRREAGRPQGGSRGYMAALCESTFQSLGSPYPRCPVHFLRPPLGPATSGHVLDAKNNTCSGTKQVCLHPLGK